MIYYKFCDICGLPCFFYSIFLCFNQQVPLSIFSLRPPPPHSIPLPLWLPLSLLLSPSVRPSVFYCLSLYPSPSLTSFLVEDQFGLELSSFIQSALDLAGQAVAGLGAVQEVAWAALLHELSAGVSSQLAEAIGAVDDGVERLHLCIPQHKVAVWEEKESTVYDSAQPTLSWSPHHHIIKITTSSHHCDYHIIIITKLSHCHNHHIITLSESSMIITTTSSHYHDHHIITWS